MLRLEKLEMLGFKSFFSRTEFHFSSQVTAVVGPNGCGKSNIGDALNWVIGEQSVKSLRGDRMEDVIFNGSEGRKPLGMAEVSLHLRNGQGEGEEERVVITRRLFRSGESEYLMNGERSRLRDIQEALARINVGSGVYAIIEQGKVDAALSSRPRERRVLIEEAAGIALYKAKKRHAETKLEATEANLLRVHDIVVELERQVGSLKRQAARARRYGRTVEEIARKERILLFHEHERLQGERLEVERREEAARARESEAGAHLATLEAQFEEGRRRLDEMEAAWRRSREELHALDREMDHHEREIALARDQEKDCDAGARAAREQEAGLSGRLTEVALQIEDRRAERGRQESRCDAEEREKDRLDAQRHALEDRIDALERDLAGARSAFLAVVDAGGDARNRRRQIEESRARVDRQAGALEREMALALEESAACERARVSAEAALASGESRALTMAEELRGKREALARLEEALARETSRREEARHRVHGHEERLKALEEIEATGVGAKELLAGLVAHDGLIADGLAAPDHVEAAVEIYLAPFLDAALVGGAQEAIGGIASLKRAGQGRAGFLPAAAADTNADTHPLIGLPEEVRSDPGFLGRLGDLVEVDLRRRQALASALARGLVVADLETASRLRRHAPFFDYITLDGDVLHTTGLIEGGARRPEGTGVLTRRRLIASLRTDIEAGRSHMSQLDVLIAGLEQDRGRGLAEVTGLAEATAAAEKDLVELRLRAEVASQDEARARLRGETVRREQSAAAEEASALDLEMTRLTSTLADLEQARRQREQAIASGQDEIASVRDALSRLVEAATVVRSSLSASRQRLESLDTDLARLLESDQELRDRIEREAARALDLIARGEEASQRSAASASALQELAARRTGVESLVKEGEVALAERRIDSERQGQAVRPARGALEEARASREQVSLERERVASDLRHLLSSSDGLEDLFAALTQEEKQQEPAVLRAALEELRQRRDRMGPVNMMALDQFRELEERHAFLTAQRKDLMDAIASLKETIARINRTSRERFMEAFEKIRSGFTEIHRSLFGGGRADLRLLTGDGQEDVLECGIEITAQPPGKRLQSVTLLSGGEKALTAIALLFAIFKYRPSPFCLLDEVDAPLDEANVIRFNQLLKSMATDTQFVMITHNRSSMEAADMLYGITMDEPGVSRTISVVMEHGPDRAETIRSLPSLLAARHKGGGPRARVPAGAALHEASSGGNGRHAGTVDLAGPLGPEAAPETGPPPA